MQLFIIIVSTLVLPSFACVACKSLMCPRAGKNDLSSSTLAQAIRIQAGSEKTLSKRAGKPYVKQPRGIDPIRKALEGAKLFIIETGFNVSRSTYCGRRVTLKTYSTNEVKAATINEYMDKWKRIKHLIGLFPDLDHPEGPRFHLVLDNYVPDSISYAYLITQALSIHISDIQINPAFKEHAIANPQEFKFGIFREQWFATPIYFGTETPIDMAISRATHLTQGENFYIFRTAYNDRPVTLKTYANTIGSDDTYTYVERWREVNLLIGTTVNLVPGQEFHSMILGNYIPAEMTEKDMKDAISRALSIHEGMTSAGLAFALANPQEFIYVKLDTWVATQIRFGSHDPISIAIKNRAEPSITEGTGFSIYRTMYNDKEVTLKTYTTIDFGKIYAYSERWKKKKLLLDAAVDMGLDYIGEIKNFYIIMDNRVPEMSPNVMHDAIAKAFKGNANLKEDFHIFANPQECHWEQRPPPQSPIATPIDFRL